MSDKNKKKKSKDKKNSNGKNALAQLGKKQRTLQDIKNELANTELLYNRENDKVKNLFTNVINLSGELVQVIMAMQKQNLGLVEEVKKMKGKSGDSK